MIKKMVIISIMAIFFVSLFWVIEKISERKLAIVGYLNKADFLTITINGTPMNIELLLGEGKIYDLLIDRDFEYHSLNSIDKLHIKLDSSNYNLIDTVILLPKSMNMPRVFFQNPNEKNGMRKVVLIDDAITPLRRKL
jgi:hypothetical protein